MQNDKFFSWTFGGVLVHTPTVRVYLGKIFCCPAGVFISVPGGELPLFYGAIFTPSLLLLPARIVLTKNIPM